MDNNNLFQTVITNNYCIGCGACNFVNPKYQIEMDQYGMYKANIDQPDQNPDDPALKVCPFSNLSENEDVIAERQFANAQGYNKFIGKYIQNYVGYVDEGNFRDKGSSGGFGKWILNELLQTGEVDYVIQVISANEPGKLFTFQIFKKGDEITNGSKSAYYPVTLKDVFTFIKANEGQYAITAVPCFSKAIRNVCEYDYEMAGRVKYIIGIICGHLKSTGFAESLAWQLDVNPQQLGGIEFRGKIEGLSANDKGVYANDLSGQQSKIASSKKLYGGNWGWGFFKYKACDYCDDIVGETADVSVGDAWLPDLMKDHKGNSVIIIRNKKIANIVSQAIVDGRLHFTEVEDEIVVTSQLGGIRHRREGLAYRLFNKKKKKEWFPQKRVKPSRAIPQGRKRLYKIREQIREASHVNFLKAKQANDFLFFKNQMDVYIAKFKLPTFIKVLNRLIDNVRGVKRL